MGGNFVLEARTLSNERAKFPRVFDITLCVRGGDCLACSPKNGENSAFLVLSRILDYCDYDYADGDSITYREDGCCRDVGVTNRGVFGRAQRICAVGYLILSGCLFWFSFPYLFS